ncbi:hypothetical protein C8A01DRAFT_15310 [Parachaetomium inaequale]|uniref:AB hydrolase-1 domain-containing protein n=1 Tax=Parachaetomium inaequale TaxID=2588326 RepID=A0AAN6PH14_9PEZI|nr:hypothetical protein C8A01DRAFT_15310 [Parachaetomium inaequale]
MEPFVLPLSNNSRVADIHSLPPHSASDLKSRPLVVGLHGGTYDSHYFDPNAKYSASQISGPLGISFIFIDSSCYRGTGSFLPAPEGSTSDSETGAWLHQYILPALWSRFVVPNSCNSLVIFGHSLGLMGCVVAAAPHALDQASSYPLAGIVVPGLGTGYLMLSNSGNPADTTPHPPKDTIHTPEVKDALMFRRGTVDPDILALTEQLDQPEDCKCQARKSTFASAVHGPGAHRPQTSRGSVGVFAGPAAGCWPVCETAPWYGGSISLLMYGHVDVPRPGL